MTLEELQAKLQEAQEKRKSELDALELRLKSVEGSAEKLAEIEQLKADRTTLEESIKSLGLKITTLESAPDATAKEIGEFFKSDEGKKFLADAKAGAPNDGYKLKTVNDMTIGNTVVPTATDGVLASLINGVGEIYMINRMAGSDDLLSAVTVMSTDQADIVDIEEEEGNGDVGENDEGDSIEDVDTKFNEKKSSAIELSGKMKVSERMLSDVPYMSSALTQVLNNKYMNKKQKSVATSIIAKASAFDNAVVAYPTQAKPNAFDAINAIAAQSAFVGDIPDGILMHPVDAYSLRSIKDDDGQPIAAFFSDGKTTFLNNGLRLILSKKATKGQVITGTFKNFIVQDLDLTLTIGFDGYDFGKNRRTIKVVGRFHKKLPTPNNNFVKGTLATVITALTTPVVPAG